MISNTTVVMNQSADFWFYDIGVNVIPANTKDKNTFEGWTEWQNKPIPDEVHESRKKSGYYNTENSNYNNGIAIIPGGIWRGPYKDKYLVAIDLDNKKAIDEFGGSGLEELKQKTLVEKHADPNKLHVYFIIEREITNKASDKVDVSKAEKIKANEIPALEVKSSSKGIMFCSTSPHADGSNYQIIGTRKPQVFNAQDVEERIKVICDKYNIPSGYNNNNNSSYQYQVPIEELWKSDNKILEGHNRHLELLRIMESLLQKNRKIPLDMIKQMAHYWNQNHCEPPLDIKEFEKQWKCALKFISNSIINDENNNNDDIKNRKTGTINVNDNNNTIIKSSAIVSPTTVFIDENSVESEIQSNDIFEYVIKTIKKTVKCEDALIRQILYLSFSSYIEDDPINLGIIAPTSEGKTYPITESLQYFPKEDVLYIGRMSTMALVRRKGILIDKNGLSIGPKVKELVKRKNLLDNKKENKEETNNIMEEIQECFENAKTLIDLSGKILVFLEPPKRDLWDLLKPILSHDQKEIEFPFVNKTDRDGHQTKDVVVRGWPSCIFCSAKDESKWEIWPEIKSRILVTSPNMIPQKYQESTKLISLRYGLPTIIQQQIIISDDDINRAKQCILLLKQKINEIKIKNNNDKISIWIPYLEILQKELPSNKGTDVRLQKKIFSLLNVVPIVKFSLRKLLIFGNHISVIADFDDLKEVLSITQNFEGIPKYKIEFFNNIFYPCFKSKNGIPDSNKDGLKTEDREAVTTRQLCDFYKEIKKKSISTDNLKQTYLNELNNNGLIDQERSKIHTQQYIYYPIVELLSFNDSSNVNEQEKESSSFSSNLEHFDQISQYSSTIYEKITRSINETWLFCEIMRLLSHGIDLSNIQGPVADYLNNHSEFKLLDNYPKKQFFTSSTINSVSAVEEEIQEGCCCHNDNNLEDNRRLTIRQFTKQYTDSSTFRFDEKTSPNIALFGKISTLSSKLSRFDEREE